jgi:hypothetical protein
MILTLRSGASVFMLVVLATGAALAGDNGKNARVDIRDACDPVTFDQAVGPGTCLPGHSGGTLTFSEFLAEFQEEGSVGAWRFNPDDLNSDGGVNITLRNKGGETHTFTRVQEFGGGFVPLLNGNQAPRPECAQADGSPQPPSANNIFVPSGQTLPGPTVAPGETANFQCCIHPWMHVTVTGEQHGHERHQH